MFSSHQHCLLHHATLSSAQVSWVERSTSIVSILLPLITYACREAVFRAQTNTSGTKCYYRAPYLDTTTKTKQQAHCTQSQFPRNKSRVLSTERQTIKVAAAGAHHHSEVCAVSAIGGPVQHNIHELIKSSHSTSNMSSCVEADCTLPYSVSLRPYVHGCSLPPPPTACPTTPSPCAPGLRSQVTPLSLFSMKLRSSGCCGLGMSCRMHNVAQ